MLDFLTAPGSPIENIPHTVAVFVFVLVLLHFLVFLAWLFVFARNFLTNKEDDRFRQFIKGDKGR